MAAKQTEVLSKLIEYAYPSSTTATKNGYGKTGCWFVSLYKTIDKRVKIVKFFSDKKQAEDFAETMPEPYNWMHKFHS